MKKLLFFLVLTTSILCINYNKWELQSYREGDKIFNDELMAVKMDEKGKALVVFKDVYLFYYVRDYDLRTSKDFDVILFGLDDKKVLRFKGKANNEAGNQHISLITWDKTIKDLYKNNKKIMMILPEEKNLKVEFDTEGFGTVLEGISKTSWTKIEEYEMKNAGQ